MVPPSPVCLPSSCEFYALGPPSVDDCGAVPILEIDGGLGVHFAKLEHWVDIHPSRWVIVEGYPEISSA